MKKIEKIEYLVTKARWAEDVTTSDIAEYLYFLTERLNEVIEAVNSLSSVKKGKKQYV